MIFQIIDQNNGLDAMISKVHIAVTGIDFLYSDTWYNNILKFVKKDFSKLLKILVLFNKEMKEMK